MEDVAQSPDDLLEDLGAPLGGVRSLELPEALRHQGEVMAPGALPGGRGGGEPVQARPREVLDAEHVAEQSPAQVPDTLPVVEGGVLRPGLGTDRLDGAHLLGLLQAGYIAHPSTGDERSQAFMNYRHTCKSRVSVLPVHEPGRSGSTPRSPRGYLACAAPPPEVLPEDREGDEEGHPDGQEQGASRRAARRAPRRGPGGGCRGWPPGPHRAPPRRSGSRGRRRAPLVDELDQVGGGGTDDGAGDDHRRGGTGRGVGRGCRSHRRCEAPPAGMGPAGGGGRSAARLRSRPRPPCPGRHAPARPSASSPPG